MIDKVFEFIRMLAEMAYILSGGDKKLAFILLCMVMVSVAMVVYGFVQLFRRFWQKDMTEEEYLKVESTHWVTDEELPKTDGRKTVSRRQEA
jgi:biopolymer transport protein ExbB/TolQ